MDYKIEIGDKISKNHIISLIIYTSFDNLRYQLQQTYIYKTEKEKSSIINSKTLPIGHFGRLLRECVECFGIQTKNSKINTFYHGISNNISINDISVRIKLPFSTSNRKQVIVNYYDYENHNGLLLKLKGDLSGYSPFFTCHFLSDFVNEYEQLWIGGNWPLIYKNINEITSGINLKIYLYSLHIIQTMFNGVYFEVNQQNLNEQNWKSLQEIVLKLINHRLYKANNNNNDDEKEDDDSDDDEESIDEEEIMAKQEKQQIIARRPSARTFTRSSFKPPTRSLPQLPTVLQNNILNQKNENER